MTLDTSAWKINDPEWVKQREEKWPIFEAWITSWYSQFDLKENQDLAKNISNSRRFFFEGFLNVEYENGPNKVGHETALALVPVLNADIFKDLMNYYFNFCGRYDLKNNFRGYFLNFDRYRELIKNNGVSHDFMLQLLRSAYGNSLTEAAQILEFEVEKVCYRVVNDMGPIIFNYYFNNLKTLDFHTANHLIPIYIDALKLLNDEDARNCDFVFSQHVKRKRKYYDAGLVSDPDRLAIMNRMLAEIKKVWNELNPIVQEKLSPLVE